MILARSVCYGSGLLFQVCVLTAPAVAAKGAFIREKGLLGFAMWEAVGDYQDLLLDAIENGMGVGEVC